VWYRDRERERRERERGGGEGPGRTQEDIPPLASNSIRNPDNVYTLGLV